MGEPGLAVMIHVLIFWFFFSRSTQSKLTNKGIVSLAENLVEQLNLVVAMSEVDFQKTP